MRLLLKRLWEMKFCLIFLFGLIIVDKDADKIIMAIFFTFFGLELTLKDLFKKYFGELAKLAQKNNHN